MLSGKPYIPAAVGHRSCIHTSHKYHNFVDFMNNPHYANYDKNKSLLKLFIIIILHLCVGKKKKSLTGVFAKTAAHVAT